MAQWQSRIVEQREMSPAELTAHPRNWRKHPQPQADALGGALAEVGLVQGVVFNRRTKRLLDGHLRVKLAMENRQATLPVTVVDLSEEEELTVLATLDPIGAMAEADRATLDAILAELRVEDARLAEFIAQRREKDLSLNSTPQMDGLEYRVIVDCTSEMNQRELIERLRAEGMQCRPLIS